MKLHLIALVMATIETKLKEKYNINLGEEDFKYTKSNLVWLFVVGVIGGIISGGLGIGSGVILNPALITFGIIPQVANSTGMNCVMY